MADINIPWIEEQKFDTISEFELDKTPIPWLTEDKLDANISVRWRIDTVDTFAYYNISSATLSWSTETTLTLTAWSSSWSSDFTLSWNTITIVNPWRYIVSSTLRYDNIAAWLEILIYYYKTSGWSTYAAQQTYFDWANDYVTLSTVIAVGANATLEARVDNTDTSSVDMTPIASLKIVKI